MGETAVIFQALGSFLFRLTALNKVLSVLHISVAVLRKRRGGKPSGPLVLVTLSVAKISKIIVLHLGKIWDSGMLRIDIFKTEIFSRWEDWVELLV